MQNVRLLLNKVDPEVNIVSCFLLKIQHEHKDDFIVNNKTLTQVLSSMLAYLIIVEQFSDFIT